MKLKKRDTQGNIATAHGGCFDAATAQQQPHFKLSTSATAMNSACVLSVHVCHRTQDQQALGTTVPGTSRRNTTESGATNTFFSVLCSLRLQCIVHHGASLVPGRVPHRVLGAFEVANCGK